MQILRTKENIFDIPCSINEEAVCITTNGIIKKDGNAVMGLGIAKEANERYNLASILGYKLRLYGNHVYALKNIIRDKNNFILISFPTKDHFKDRSDINLIIQSSYELAELINNLGIKKCYLPPVGCGAGGLNWNDVKSELEKILDDRFIIVIKEK